MNEIDGDLANGFDTADFQDVVIESLDTVALLDQIDQAVQDEQIGEQTAKTLQAVVEHLTERMGMPMHNVSLEFSITDKISDIGKKVKDIITAIIKAIENFINKVYDFYRRMKSRTAKDATRLMFVRQLVKMRKGDTGLNKEYKTRNAQFFVPKVDKEYNHVVVSDKLLNDLMRAWFSAPQAEFLLESEIRIEEGMPLLNKTLAAVDKCSIGNADLDQVLEKMMDVFYEPAVVTLLKRTDCDQWGVKSVPAIYSGDIVEMGLIVKDRYRRQVVPKFNRREGSNAIDLEVTVIIQNPALYEKFLGAFETLIAKNTAVAAVLDAVTDHLEKVKAGLLKMLRTEKATHEMKANEVVTDLNLLMLRNQKAACLAYTELLTYVYGRNTSLLNSYFDMFEYMLLNKD